jgi:hypothetical protein
MDGSPEAQLAFRYPAQVFGTTPDNNYGHDIDRVVLPHTHGTVLKHACLHSPVSAVSPGASLGLF